MKRWAQISFERREHSRWRHGRKQPRSIYLQLGPEPSEHDPLIALTEDWRLARRIIREHNAQLHDTGQETP